MLDPKFVAEAVAFEAYMSYHRERMAYPDYVQGVDQLRRYQVEDQGDRYRVYYIDGIDAGKLRTYATIDKETARITYA